MIDYSWEAADAEAADIWHQHLEDERPTLAEAQLDAGRAQPPAGLVEQGAVRAERARLGVGS